MTDQLLHANPNIDPDAPLLVADIGGTHARFALAQRGDTGVGLTQRATLEAAAFGAFADAVDAYLESGPLRPAHAAFAVAGPLHHDPIALTNSPWRIDRRALQARFAWRTLYVANDFAAQARGALCVSADDCETLIPGAGDTHAPRVVLGPGTGLGLGVLTPTDAGWHVQATEGGHVGFAPRDIRETALLAHLHAALGYVPAEAIISGRGIARVYAALQHMRGATPEPLDAATISARAANDPAAQETLEVFFAALGAYAGDAVLITGARGGVYIGGGIAPKLKHHFAASAFAQRFHTRGAMSDYLRDVPVYLLTSQDTALLGVAALALQL